ncbi:MAG: galactose-1-phosphate uridylyltransferase [Planctomycetes bacterium]|nr:galactose-1-phosphate uridylyltransferase [Planctomycetota bacterium]
MSEIRKDPLVPRWVIMAPERAARPIEVVDEPRAVATHEDPFAEGAEATTPPEVLAIRDADSKPNEPGWRVRVLPNKYPAVNDGGSTEVQHNGIYQQTDGIGVHEVIVECPQSEPNLSRLSVENVRDVLAVYHDRLAQLRHDPRLAHAMIFKNQGALAGASVHHSHSQLIATPFVPRSITDELTGGLEFYERHGESVFAAMIQQELTIETRIVLQTDRFLAFCPFASRFAYEVWIMPRHPGSHFESTPIDALPELGTVLKTVLRKLDVGLNDPPCNYYLHSAPFRTPELPHFRWHFEVFPRLTRVAGYEWGSGCFLNEVPPEDAAALLRATVID